jgi:hypothetical protein
LVCDTTPHSSIGNKTPSQFMKSIGYPSPPTASFIRWKIRLDGSPAFGASPQV